MTEKRTGAAIEGDDQRGSPIKRIALALFGVALVLVTVVGALALAGFFNAPRPTRESAELVRMAPAALAEARGVGYRLSVESGDAGGLLGLDSSGLIDFESQRFAGSADRGRGASMLLFGGPDSGSVVLADGLFVQSAGGPWERVPLENAAQLRSFLDPSTVAAAVGGALQRAEIDPAARTESCEAGTCQVVNMILPPAAVSDFAIQMFGQAEPPPPDLLPLEAELWLDAESGFPVRTALQAAAGGTTTRIVLDLERLDPPPAIDPPAP